MQFSGKFGQTIGWIPALGNPGFAPVLIFTLRWSCVTLILAFDSTESQVSPNLIANYRSNIILHFIRKYSSLIKKLFTVQLNFIHCPVLAELRNLRKLLFVELTALICFSMTAVWKAVNPLNLNYTRSLFRLKYLTRRNVLTNFYG